MKIIYYMPLFLTKKAETTQDPDLLDFCELFKIVNTNASIIDRTNTISTPFHYENLYPLLDVKNIDYSFSDACIKRACDILDTGKKIHILYSGGLDSTCVVLAMYLACKSGKYSFDQVVIGSTPSSYTENPVMWREYILPNFPLESSFQTLNNITIADRYVQGENADQIFGSDRVLLNPELLTTSFSKDELNRFIDSQIVRKTALDKLTEELYSLAALSPLDIKTMADFMWWLNFTCKWQSVSLRTLSFTSLFADGNGIHKDDLKSFETFFNTEEFQQLAMSTTMPKWGDDPGKYNYKEAARQFIRSYAPNLTDYSNQKLKFGSLYGLITKKQYEVNAFGIDDAGMISAVNIIE